MGDKSNMPNPKCMGSQNKPRYGTKKNGKRLSVYPQQQKDHVKNVDYGSISKRFKKDARPAPRVLPLSQSRIMPFDHGVEVAQKHGLHEKKGTGPCCEVLSVPMKLHKRKYLLRPASQPTGGDRGVALWTVPITLD